MFCNPWTFLTVRRFCLCLVLTLVFFLPSFSQSNCEFNLEIDWQKNFGGSNSEIAQNVRQTSDGGYIIGGHTLSEDFNIDNNYGGVDYWIVKTDANGNAQWDKNFGGASTDVAKAVVETSDNGFLFVGGALSSDQDIQNPYGSFDIWVVKLDGGGNLQWERSYGGTGNDRPEWIEKTSDGGYVICGTTSSNDNHFSDNKGITDAFVLKLDAGGDVQWSKTVGGSSEDFANHIMETNDGSFVASGGTFSFDGDIDDLSGGMDVMIFKLESDGTLDWVETIGGSGIEWSNWNYETSDGNYLFTGPTDSNDGDFSVNNGARDMWIAKISPQGNSVWRQVYGGSKDEIGNAIVETPSNGFLISGHSEINDGDVTSNYGNLDIWVVNCDANGNMIGDYNFGGSNSEMTEDFRATDDGGLILSGFSESDDVDLSGNFGQADFWVIKFKPLGGGLSNPELGPDQSFCESRNVFLDASVINCVGCQYAWSDGTSNSTNVVAPTETTTYSVVVTNNQGCTVSDEVTINISDLDIALDFSHPSGCVDDGIITADAIGGTGNYTYTWSNGVNGQVNPGLSSGLYNVTVNDGECESRGFVFLQAENANIPQFDLGADQTICNNTSVVLEVDLENVTSKWSNGETTNSIIVDSPGFYSVTVTNSDGCTGFDGINIEQSDQIEFSFGNDISTCEEEYLLTSPISASNYSWSTGESSESILITQSGIYELMVSDEEGCTGEAFIQVILNESFEFSLGQDLSDCDAFIFETNITEDVDFLWGDGSSTNSIEISETGTYSLTITNEEGCTSEDDILITIFESPDIDLGENSASCEPLDLFLMTEDDLSWSTGSTENEITVSETDWYFVTVTNENNCSTIDSVFVEIMDSPPIEVPDSITSCQTVLLDYSNESFQISWDTGENSNLISFDESGDYMFTITNEMGCTSESQININIVEELELNLGEDIVSCTNVILETGLNNLEYNWSSGQTQNQIEITQTGNYIVTVTDPSGCSVIDEINVTINEALNFELGEDIVSCSEVTIGSQLAEGSHLWSNGSTANNITVEDSGTYTLEVTSDFGCVSMDTIQIEIIDEIPLDLGEDIISCNSLTLESSITNSELNYDWSTGENASSIEVSQSGTYILIVSTDEGCASTDTVEIVIEEAPVLELGEDVLACGTAQLTTEVEAASYEWSNGNTGNSTVVEESGYVSLIVSTANGCSSKDSVLVTLTDGFEVDWISERTTCFGFFNGRIEIFIEGAIGDVIYDWETGDTSPIVENLTAGRYEVTITDEAGCEQVRVIEVGQPDEIELELVELQSLGCSTENAFIEVSASGGEGTLSYEWSYENGQPIDEASSTLIVTEPGVYIASAFDENGCRTSASFEIFDSGQLDADIELITPLACAGEESASMNVRIFTGQEPYSLTLTNQTTSETRTFDELELNGLGAGEYLLIVNDASGCELQIEFTIEEPQEIGLNIFGTSVCGDFGYAVADIVGGTAPFDYEWSNGGTTDIISQLASGNYALTITDAKGCTSIGETTIDNFEEVIFETTIGQLACHGDEDAFISINVLQGTAPYTYEWQNGNANATIENIGAGSYTVFVTDANGCETASSIDVYEPESIGVQYSISLGQDQDNATLEIFPFGGTAPYQIDWADSSSSNSIRTGLSFGTYTVIITDANGCEYSEEITIDDTVSSHQLIISSLQVYPNPFNNDIFINGEVLSEVSHLELHLYNTLGQKILSQKIQDSNLNIKVETIGLPAGVYSLVLNDGNKVSKSFKLVKL